MPKASPIRTAFNAGELSPLLDGRVDVAKYQNGCRVMENFIPTVQGPAIRRPGTRFVSEVKNSAYQTWLARFEFSASQVFLLEFGNNYVRFYTAHGQLLVTGVAAYSGATTYGAGDLVVSGSINYYCKTTTTGNAPPNATYWYPLTGNIYEVPSPYSAADLINTDGTFRLSMTQSGDVIYIAHSGYPVQKLSRYSNTQWTFGNALLTNGPFQTQNSTRTATMYSSATSGAGITLTSSTAQFTAPMVGSLVYLEPADLSLTKPWTAGQEFLTASPPLNVLRRSNGKTYKCTTAGAPTAAKVWRTGPDKPNHVYGTVADGAATAIDGTNVEKQGLDWLYVDSGYGYLEITGYTSSTVVTCKLHGTNPLPSGVVGVGNATFRWKLGAFSGVLGYPNRVTFFRERLALSKNQSLYFSVSSDFDNFASKDDSGDVTPDAAINVTISSDQVDLVQWMAPTGGLILGTNGGEYICSENSTSEAFAPANVKIEQTSADGSRSMTPIRVGYSVLFAQRSGRKLREIAYNFQQGNYVTNDLTVLSDHITESGMVQATWHKEPYVAAWIARADGVLLGFTINRDQDVVGWHRHIIGGLYAGGHSVVESVCAAPAPDGTRDELWLIVKRTINGITRRFVEYLERGYQTGDSQGSCYYVDAGASYDGTNITATTVTVSGGVTTWGPDELLTITSSAALFQFPATTDVGDAIVITSGGIDYKITIVSTSSTTVAQGYPDKVIIVGLRNFATAGWSFARNKVSGLSYLEGQTVQVLADGATHPDRVVASGAITLQVAAKLINIGLGYVSTLQTNRIEAGAADGTAQGKTKRINKCVVRFYNTLGAKVGPDSDSLDELQFRTGSDPMDAPPPLFTGDKLLEFPGDYDFEGYIMVRQDSPLPMTVVAIMPQVTTFDR